MSGKPNMSRDDDHYSPLSPEFAVAVARPAASGRAAEQIPRSLLTRTFPIPSLRLVMGPRVDARSPRSLGMTMVKVLVKFNSLSALFIALLWLARKMHSAPDKLQAQQKCQSNDKWSQLTGGNPWRQGASQEYAGHASKEQSFQRRGADGAQAEVKHRASCGQHNTEDEIGADNFSGGHI